MNSSQVGLLSGKVAVVTGGGSGMGREICLAYSEAGAEVVVASNVEDRNRQVADSCLQSGGLAHSHYVDVSDPESVEELFNWVSLNCGHVDVLVNAAAIGQGAVAPEPDARRLIHISHEQWQEVLDVNLTGTFLCSRAAVLRMASQDGGSIINFTSGTVRFPIPNLGVYTTSKWGVEGLTRLLALETDELRIRVNLLQPGGPVDTELLFPDTEPERRAKMHEPSVIRSAAVWLASDASRLISGRSFVAMQWNKERGIQGCSCESCGSPSILTSFERWNGSVFA